MKERRVPDNFLYSNVFYAVVIAILTVFVCLRLIFSAILLFSLIFIINGRRMYKQHQKAARILFVLAGATIFLSMITALIYANGGNPVRSAIGIVLAVIMTLNILAGSFILATAPKHRPSNQSKAKKNSSINSMPAIDQAFAILCLIFFVIMSIVIFVCDVFIRFPWDCSSRSRQKIL